MKAERCPVCYGTGKYIDPPDPTDPMTTAGSNPRTCHGCAGKGWVEIHDDPIFPLGPTPYSPYPHPYTYYSPPSTIIWYSL